MSTLTDRWKAYYNTQGWKQHYAQEAIEWEKRESAEEDGESFSESTVNAKPTKAAEEKPVSSMKRRDVKVLLYVRELLRRQAQKAEERERALAIRQVDKTDYIMRPGSTESYIFQALFMSEEPMHINRIIEHMEESGWESSSELHKWVSVYKILRENDYMFQRVAPATFKLCEGFRGRLPVKGPRTNVREVGDKISTLRDVVVNVTEEYQDKYGGTWPGQVHYIMERMGFKCAYSTVYRIMQSKNFMREGYWYKLREAE